VFRTGFERYCGVLSLIETDTEAINRIGCKKIISCEERFLDAYEAMSGVDSDQSVLLYYLELFGYYMFR
jgi:hypothetical protein